MLTVRKLFELNTLLFQEKLGEKNNRNAYLIHLSIFFFCILKYTFDWTHQDL